MSSFGHGLSTVLSDAYGESERIMTADLIDVFGIKL